MFKTGDKVRFFKVAYIVTAELEYGLEISVELKSGKPCKWSPSALQSGRVRIVSGAWLEKLERI